MNGGRIKMGWMKRGGRDKNWGINGKGTGKREALGGERRGNHWENIWKRWV